uniref:Uncharacterized protein n=1 Tax=Ovis aries TaxID=9940 RepID=A0AC11DZA5_SHEEP
MPARTHDLKRDTRSQEQGFPDRNGVGGTKAAPRAKPLGPARPEAPARNWQIISAGWVWDAGGAFGKREQAEEKHSFQAQKHHEHEISHHTKEAECLERGTERHRNCIQYPLINHNGREYEKAYLYMYI